MVLGLCFAVAASAAKTLPVPMFEPDAGAPSSGELHGATWVGGGATWKIWVKQLDPAERLNFIERTTGFAIDPFVGRPDQPPSYHTFLVVLENNGSGALSFNPQSCWLKTNRNKVFLPQGLADLSFNYRVTGREFPVAYENVQHALLERTVSVAPGERIAGLLVYDRIPDKTKRWGLSLRLTHSDGEQASYFARRRRGRRRASRRKGSPSSRVTIISSTGLTVTLTIVLR